MSDNRDNDPSTPRNDPHAPLIFRDEALSHLSSPGDMNKLVTLTRPYTWILLIIFIILTGIGILWSIYGRIPITLQGQGILIPKGGIFESITAPEGVNTIQELTIHPGDLVTKDQIVALLDNPELKKNIADRSYYIDVLKEKMIAIQKEGRESLQAKVENNQKQIDVIKSGIEDKNTHQRHLEKNLEQKKELFKKSYVNITDILNIESQINVIKDEKRREKEKMLQMQQDETAHKEMWAQKERELSLKLIDEERDFANLIAKRDATHAIKSPISGRILSIHKNVGDKVLVNDIVMTMGKGDDNNLEALLYFNPLEGKEMKENARVYMIPTYLEKEHRGFMEGRIMHISPYPETARSLMKALQNEELVKKFTETNPPISARVSLDRVSMVSSLLSPLTPGTWLYARVVVHQSSPLALIIPELKKLLGMQQ